MVRQKIQTGRKKKYEKPMKTGFSVETGGLKFLNLKIVTRSVFSVFCEKNKTG
jgi:hypothetical protein